MILRGHDCAPLRLDDRGRDGFLDDCGPFDHIAWPQILAIENSRVARCVVHERAHVRARFETFRAQR